jgi:pimeloyl-ACP methyl ester carboxylesterase
VSGETRGRRDLGAIEQADLVERRTRVYDEEVAWQVAGSGPPLVCVHGLGGSWRWWLAVLPRLAQHRQVHLVDLPRFSALGGFRPDDASDWLERWLAAAGLERPALMGHSLGGLLAAQVAGRTELERLVLVAPAGLPTGRDVSGELTGLVHALVRTAPGFLPTIGLDVLRWGPEALWHGMRYALSVDLRRDLEQIAAPTLLVWGEEDLLVPVAQAPAWEEAIPDARLVIVPDAAHIPMVEVPEAFVDAVIGFLREVRVPAIASPAEPE